MMLSTEVVSVLLIVQFVSLAVGQDNMDCDDTRPCMNENGVVCNNAGRCVCGMCQCNKQTLSGQFCECDSMSCPYYNGKLCGGLGRCECGMCVCAPGWTGDSCQCPVSPEACIATGAVDLCSGRGTCDCGRCKCDGESTGEFCEDHPDESGDCIKFRDCVECKTFGTGNLTGKECVKCSDQYNIDISIVDSIKLEDLRVKGFPCLLYTDDGCVMYFLVAKPEDGRQKITADGTCKAIGDYDYKDYETSTHDYVNPPRRGDFPPEEDKSGNADMPREEKSSKNRSGASSLVLSSSKQTMG
ncbi:PAT3-like protein [Mya arenaria]|uniref:PAT3-like protein n=1 Tax=Mya arenaria TaxID=6604 RepID=A0ABY7EWK6_MYAAR|nr:PAT3-like protein [Mya arenaria]